MNAFKATFVSLLLPCLTLAYTNNDVAKTAVSDGSQLDTQNAINYIDGKNQDGWVLTVGTAGGSYTWTSAVNLPATFVNSVTITSAGGAGNHTIITANFTASGQALGLRATDNKLCRVTGFTFRVTAGQTLGSGFIDIDQTSTGTMRNSFRIDHCRFEDCQNIAITVLGPNRGSSGACYGLVDHCDFAITSGANGLYIYSGANGDNWTTSGTSGGNMTWGTADTVVVEDCTFTMTGLTVEGRPAIDASYFGARYMMRHCTFTNWVCVAHGADSAPTSTLQVELLHNTFLLNANDPVDFIMYLRGGSMRFWDNTVTLSNGAALNQIIKTANDSPLPGSPIAPGEHFQQVGHGTINGAESFVPVYVWSNTTPGGVVLFGHPNNNDNLVLGTHYILSDPGNYTELQYPHPLTLVGSTAPNAPSALNATSP